MSLLTLKNIGKIYVSDNNVAVGIRGVNLSMDRGEFVAVTGKSGSGKSTLLNVLSGMDTYEEGELYVEGEPTSHFLQKDWEEYRKKYISFIFQDYNIIESFTVLQNVELALMHISNPRQRRKRALELIRRVGLEKHLHHKGSKLSGGQKQRTVIARALAKDSPIILADEPTGNLDSQTSVEIIELLREVSKEKLVVVVTHNFEQVEAVATRHIRIYDGAVEADEVISAPEPLPDLPAAEEKPKKLKLLADGATLGMARFFATPKLSVFLCILMLLTALVVTLNTSFNSEGKEFFQKNYLFEHIRGRSVIVRSDGNAITDNELSDLAAKVGADSYEHYDFMLDQTINLCIADDCYNFRFGIADRSAKPDVGRLPEKENEVLLIVPLALKSKFGDASTFQETLLPLMMNAPYTVTGVKYQIDNTKDPQLLFSDSGYRTATALAFFEQQRSNMRASIHYKVQGDDTVNSLGLSGSAVLVDFSLPQNTWYITDAMQKEIKNQVKNPTDFSATLTGNFQTYRYDDYFYYDDYKYYSYDGNYGGWGLGYGDSDSVTYSIPGTLSTTEPPIVKMIQELAATDSYYFYLYQSLSTDYFLVVSPEALSDFLYNNYYKESYTQASLFFASDSAAHKKVAELRELGYVSVPSDTTAKEEFLTALISKISMLFSLLGWLIVIVFATLFLNLCSSKAMSATQGDIAIMRSMGISTPVIKIGVFMQTLFCLIPTFLGMAITLILIYTSPVTNKFFPYLHVVDYLLIGIALLLINLNLSRKYIRKMFGQSVKKSLRGGNKE